MTEQTNPSDTQTQADGAALLKGFLDRHKITYENAGEALKVTRVTIWSWINRKSTPLEASRQDIETWTAGDVPSDAWGGATDKRKRSGMVVTPFQPPQEPEAGSPPKGAA